MQSFGARYASLLGVTMGVFVTFVACGSQLYQVSLKNDSGPRPSTTATASAGASAELMGNGPADNTDPTSANYAIHAPHGWTNLPIHYQLDFTLSTTQVSSLQKAMHTWEVATGRTLFAYDGLTQSVTGDTFKDLYSSLDDNINGLYFDGNWTKTGKADVVLATTIWDNAPSDVFQMSTADIRYNNQDYVFGDAMLIKPQGSREVVDLQTVATHELGHFLGLNHVDPSVDPQSIMVASLYIGQGITERGLSLGDITRIQHIYGCAGAACDLEATQATIAAMVRETEPVAAGATTTSTGASSANTANTTASN